ncbi:heat shock 70 kDa protein 8 [Andrographis paniculata]|uniref:heat shock 70 kDa protein 8 n=1 Tax=Andrographis paniculata TaxID=175694 RepID=UPI0021E90324|nr:heat shock 70 kDa protein 8 [Andrographis paniculata]XP_051129532.1 heat shock 70 kDa protein 8 [Andrographis paniculata]
MAEQAYTVASDSEATGEEKSVSPTQEIAIGIDIGTSQCSVAVWNGSQVELLRNTRNQKMMLSYVTFKDEIPAGGVSNQLAHAYEMLSGAAVFNMKRLIGRVDTDPVVHASKSLPFLVQTLNIGVRPFIAALVKNAWRSTTPEEVLAVFFVELKSLAEVKLKRPVRNVVLTIPVSFSRFQISRVERACAMAGLQVLRLMPEPTAIALLYSQQHSAQENSGSGIEKNAVIFNMGAGFCDVGITATAGGISHIKALAGAAVGGEDILLNTMRHLLPEMDDLFAARGIDEIKKMGLLRVATQNAIHILSSQPTAKIDVDLGDGKTIRKSLDRNEFEKVNQEVFEKSESLVRKCLLDAKVDVKDINDVILVGGCSNVPKLREIVTGIFNRDPYSGIHPFEAAVRGAALEGALASGATDPFGSLDLLTIQATPLSIGIQADGDSFIPIILKNTTIPVRRDLFLTTVHDNQAEALIIVYEGDEKVVEKNHLLGYFKIGGIPPAPKGVPEINVCMDIDASNKLRVAAGVVMPGGRNPEVPFIEVRMPSVDDGHGWFADALNRVHGSSLDLVTVKR